ncbi:unnamed protein product, partial [marine sediment metagenome]
MLLVDITLLSYLWLIANTCVSLLLHDVENYQLIPIVWMIPFIVLGVSLWQSLGRTAGMVVVRRYPMTEMESSPSIGQRLLHWIGWFVFPIGVVTALLDPYGRLPAEYVSGIYYTEPRADMAVKPKPWYRTSLGLIVFVVGLF